MSDTTTRPGESIETALSELAAARDGLTAAKRARSPELIENARRRMQLAVDRARDQHVGWGEIGSALGIARGNAYQRYRIRSRLSLLPPFDGPPRETGPDSESGPASLENLLAQPGKP